MQPGSSSGVGPLGVKLVSKNRVQNAGMYQDVESARSPNLPNSASVDLRCMLSVLRLPAALYLPKRTATSDKIDRLTNRDVDALNPS